MPNKVNKEKTSRVDVLTRGWGGELLQFEYLSGRTDAKTPALEVTIQ